jgi:hypothetical protein
MLRVGDFQLGRHDDIIDDIIGQCDHRRNGVRTNGESDLEGTQQHTRSRAKMVAALRGMSTVGAVGIIPLNKGYQRN